MSKYARPKFRVMDKPYVLDEQMVSLVLLKVIELGKNKAFVKDIFPSTLKMRRCIDSFGFLTRDVEFPYNLVFAGQVIKV